MTTMASLTSPKQPGSATSPDEARPPAPALPEHERAIIDDEMAMSDKVARAVADAFSGKGEAPVLTGPDVTGELVSLRDQIAEARLEDVPALLNEMMRVAAVAQVDTPGAGGAVDGRSPYFGHMRLKETLPQKGARKARTSTRDVLIGKRALVDREAGVVIVDWRNAPVSRLYYRYDEGDDYDESFGDEEREGEVLVRRTVTFDEGRLMRIRTPGNTFVRADEEHGGEWVAVGAGREVELTGGAGVAARAPAQTRRSRPAPPSNRGRRRRGGKGRRQRDDVKLGHEGPSHLRPDKHLPEIAALIDPQQFEAMTQSDSGVVVLQGGAGSGKTTVALHRIAWLAYQDPQGFRPHRMLVTVKQPALVKYTERVLPSLDVPDVKVQAFFAFCKEALRWILPGPHRREIAGAAPSEVARLKKHPAMLRAMQRQVERRLVQARKAIEERTSGRPGADLCLAAFDDRERTDAPLLVQLGDVWRGVDTCRAPEDTRERARRAVESVRSQARDLVAEWEELVTDRELLSILVGGDITEADLDRFLAWTAQQVEEPDDDDIDPEAKRPVDEGEDDEGPRYQIEPEDVPLFLNLWIERTGGLVNPRTNKALEYDHIAVDEAQDLSAVEIRPLLIAAGKRRSLTLAGDTVQKVVFDNGFDTWEELMEQLSVRGVMVEPFRLSYRSTVEVTAFAQEILGHLAHDKLPSAVRHGADVEVFAFPELGEEVAFLADALRAVMNREPNASVALLTRYPERAAFFYELLEKAEVPHLRLIDNGDFPFTPGVDVTHIEQVKGLEYDYVVLCEVTDAMYPPTDPSRHLLHIGATRAAHQLWATTQTKHLSPILPTDLVSEL
jgi:DNA helicase-2/ATP-dependent DNA helicase PcrA